MRSMRSDYILPSMVAAAMMVIPLLVLAPTAQAQSASAEPPSVVAHSSVKHATTKRRAESVERRIDELHASLQITAQEDAAWQKVAQSMRDNDSAQLKLEAEQADHAPSSVTAVQHMQNYQNHVQLHLDGMKSLAVVFDALYAQMPAQQKLITDEVFRGPKNDTKAAHG